MDKPKKDIIAFNIPNREMTDEELDAGLDQCIQILTELKNGKKNIKKSKNYGYIMSDVFGLTKLIHDIANK